MESTPPPDCARAHRAAARPPQSPAFARSSSASAQHAIQRITRRSVAARCCVADATCIDATCHNRRCNTQHDAQHTTETHATTQYTTRCSAPQPRAARAWSRCMKHAAHTTNGGTTQRDSTAVRRQHTHYNASHGNGAAGRLRGADATQADVTSRCNAHRGNGNRCNGNRCNMQHAPTQHATRADATRNARRCTDATRIDATC
jgi:hypothetical protein